MFVDKDSMTSACMHACSLDVGLVSGKTVHYLRRRFKFSEEDYQKFTIYTSSSEPAQLYLPVRIIRARLVLLVLQGDLSPR
jgi:hypothetical protein